MPVRNVSRPRLTPRAPPTRLGEGYRMRITPQPNFFVQSPCVQKCRQHFPREPASTPPRSFSTAPRLRGCLCFTQQSKSRKQSQTFEESAQAPARLQVVRRAPCNSARICSFSLNAEPLFQRPARDHKLNLKKQSQTFKESSEAARPKGSSASRPCEFRTSSADRAQS